ncbi:MAG: hypothetical protein ACRDRL_00125 [Sciscionella sp.]
MTSSEQAVVAGLKQTPDLATKRRSATVGAFVAEFGMMTGFWLTQRFAGPVGAA